MRFLICLLAFIIASCAGIKGGPGKGAENATEMTLTPVSFSALPGWNDPNKQDAALGAFTRSCQVFMKRAPSTPVAPNAVAGKISNWLPACNAFFYPKAPLTGTRDFFEAHFTPYKITTPNGDEGLFTGYYEAQLKGSRVRTDYYTIPVYKRPADLVMVDLGAFRPSLKGERIAGRVVDGNLKPYADRAAIDRGALSGQKLELAWVHDADALFFMHIQGSGQIYFEDGSVQKLGYDGQNGHVYTAIGRELIARGDLTKENTSLQTIRAWLQRHPDQASGLRQKNASYIFFKDQGTAAGNGPIGAQNVALTAQGSLAVDPKFVPYGAPVYVDVQHPLQAGKLSKLLVAQDTGGAIRGPVRGDVFWGSGEGAEHVSGLMKSRGQAWILLPRTLPVGKRTVAY